MPCKDDVFSSTVKTWLLQVEIRFCNERAKPLEPVDITLLRYLLDTLDHACSFAKCAAVLPGARLVEYSYHNPSEGLSLSFRAYEMW
jgi:hypothetical protein